MVRFGTAFIVNEDSEYFVPEMIQYEVTKAGHELGKRLIKDVATKKVIYWYETPNSKEMVPLEQKQKNTAWLRYSYTEYRFELNAEPVAR